MVGSKICHQLDKAECDTIGLQPSSVSKLMYSVADKILQFMEIRPIVLILMGKSHLNLIMEISFGHC